MKARFQWRTLVTLSKIAMREDVDGSEREFQWFIRGDFRIYSRGQIKLRWRNALWFLEDVEMNAEGRVNDVEGRTEESKETLLFRWKNL